MNRKMGIVVLVLSLLAAPEPLSIDLYLPAFADIAESLQVSMGEVQISLSIFLAGFAIGQLFWGSLSDYYGRKNPILLATALYTVSSFVSIYVTSIESLWVIRFFQALIRPYAEPSINIQKLLDQMVPYINAGMK